MNWHTRYLQQAEWTRELRAYLFGKIQPSQGQRVLEVGCGTGAILASLESPASLHGLDISCEALKAARIHVSRARLVRGDAHTLPYREQAFDITYCHYLLLWVNHPEQAIAEMKRVTKAKGFVLALAEPDYTARLDGPGELVELGRLQNESLRNQGAQIDLGAHLADLFFRAGLHIIETGTIRNRSETAAVKEEQQEWEVLESDLARVSPPAEIRRWKHLDREARQQSRRQMFVPTYFVWAQV